MSKPIYIEKSLIKSKAFNSLTGKSAQVLMIIMTKRVFRSISGKKSRYSLVNNGEINFTYSEAKKFYGFSDGVFKRAISQLIDTGFIKVESNGGLYKQPNKFRLLENWKDFGTHKFRLPEKTKNRYEGIGFQKGNKYGKNCKKRDNS